MSNKTSWIFNFYCKAGITVTTRWRLATGNTTSIRSTVSAFSRCTIQQKKFICLVPTYGYLTRELTSIGKANFKTKGVNLRSQFKHHSRSFSEAAYQCGCPHQTSPPRRLSHTQTSQPSTPSGKTLSHRSSSATADCDRQLNQHHNEYGNCY